MSNWIYAGQMPTVKWRNAMTIPSDLLLKQINGEILVASEPVKELTGIEMKPVVNIPVLFLPVYRKSTWCAELSGIPRIRPINLQGY